jgi:hypothetical protein
MVFCEAGNYFECHWWCLLADRISYVIMYVEPVGFVSGGMDCGDFFSKITGGRRIAKITNFTTGFHR